MVSCICIEPKKIIVYFGIDTSRPLSQCKEEKVAVIIFLLLRLVLIRRLIIFCIALFLSLELTRGIPKGKYGSNGRVSDWGQTRNGGARGSLVESYEDDADVHGYLEFVNIVLYTQSNSFTIQKKSVNFLREIP